MQLPKSLNLQPGNILKIAGLVIVATVIIVFAFRLIGSAVNSISPKSGVNSFAIQSAPAYDSDLMFKESANEAVGYVTASRGSMGLSFRNAVGLAPTAIYNTVTTGDTAEAFEVTEYNAQIPTRRLSDTCASVAALKTREDVIFENTRQFDRGCYFGFKVKRGSLEEILNLIKALNPKELTDNTYTIKNQVDDYTSATEILQKKMATIDETLANAVEAYDDLSALATKTQDVESLAKIIDSKINLIERLTVERLNISTQLDQLSRSKADQLDRLDYAYFSVNVWEDKFVDGQNLKDSWKMALKSFVADINETIQAVTINLVALLFLVLSYVLYFFIVLIIVKYVWRLAKYLWLKK